MIFRQITAKETTDAQKKILLGRSVWGKDFRTMLVSAGDLGFQLQLCS
jgi:hypothetical protein